MSERERACVCARAPPQTSRINVKSTSQAAAAQVAAVALATAFGKKKAAQAGVSVKNPMGTCCVDVARLWASQHAEPQGLFAAALSSKLVFNACPTKLSADSIMSTARFLAENEVECMISERMGRADALDKLCAAIRSPGTTSLDVVWSSIVLIVYLCCHPRGRDLLSNTQLTDVDYHTASTLEAYGRAEITRRVRLDQLQATRHASPPKRARGVKKEDKGERKVAKEEEGEEGEEEEEEGEEEDDLQDFLDEEESAEAKILASKRKRGAKGCASASTSDSLGLLSWWYFALRSDEKSVLLSLVAHTKQAARDAAFQTLQKQTSSTPGVVQNEIIKGISEQNAVQSACALVPFVGRKVSEIPAALAWRWKNEIHCGLTRTHDEAHATTVHACSMLKASLQPKADTKIKVAWSQANMNFAPQSKAFSVFPAVTERLHEMIVYAATGLRQAVAASRMSAVTYADCMAPKTVDTSGIARSVISFAMRVDLSETVVLSGTQLAEELQAVHASARSAGCGEAGGGVGSSSNKFLAAESRDARARIEPLVSPSSVLGVGIALNEELKNWLSSPVQKSRKNNFTKVLLGSATQKQMSGPAPSIVDSEPLPLLTICDVHTHLESDTSQTEEAVVGVGLSVCGEGAVRVPEVAKALMANHAELGWVGAYRHARAVVFTASSQSSYISDVGARISASNANSAIQSSKKINVPDEHRVGFLSPLDCYVVGLPNVAVSHLGSGHMGAYGCPLDHGVSPPGLLAHNYRSDKRQHGVRICPTALVVADGGSHSSALVRACAVRTGNMTLSEQAANDLAQMFAEAHYVKCADGKTYCEAPIYARGIPHGLLPGIHSCLNDLVDALEVFRESTNRLDSATVDVVASLAFSPWTQAIAPTIEATADLSMRLCVRDPSLLSTGSGKAYLPDSTDPDRAIASPPLLEGPVQVSVADNPFSTSYGHIDSFFNAANTCVLLARTLAPKGQSAVAFLRATISAFVFGEAHCGRTHGPEHSFLAADALVLLSSMYPSEWCIAKPCLLPVWAKALPAVARMVSRQDAVETFVTLDQCVDDAHEVAAGREWWGRFAREDEELCAWSNGVGPLLQALDEHDGSYDVTKEKAGMMRERLETAVRAGFLANSVDGVAPPEDPCPAHTALSAAKVKRPHVDPTFVGDSRQGIVPKGCLVGLKPHQLRQVCALALGACLPDVEVQVSRNEGTDAIKIHLYPIGPLHALRLFVLQWATRQTTALATTHALLSCIRCQQS